MSLITRCLVILAAVGVLAAGESLAVGAQAPALGVKKTLNVNGGRVFDVADLKGRVVVIDFWATWCGPCVASIPHVEKTWQKYKDKGVVVIGHTNETSQDLPSFIKQNRMTYPITIGAEIGGAYGVRGIPHIYVIDHEGKVAWHGHPSELEDSVIDKVLAKAPPRK